MIKCSKFKIIKFIYNNNKCILPNWFTFVNSSNGFKVQVNAKKQEHYYWDKRYSMNSKISRRNVLFQIKFHFHFNFIKTITNCQVILLIPIM